MRYFKILSVVVGLSALLSACEQPTLSMQQKKQGFCRSMVQAANAIMLDRQQRIPKAQAIAHAKKIPDIHTRNMILSYIDEAYALTAVNDLQSKEQAMKSFLVGKYENCLAK